MTMSQVTYGIRAAGPGEDQPTLELALTAGGPALPPPLVQQPINLVRSSRNPTDGADVRWTSGFSYLPLESGDLSLRSDCPPGNAVNIAGPDAGIADWMPYILSASFSCSMMGYDEQDYTNRARSLLDAATPKLIEYEFWNGAIAQAAVLPNKYLKQSGVQTYAATSVNQAIGICEQYISAVGPGGRGMIHAPAYLTPYLQMIARREGNLLLTYRDTIVVPGSGYGNNAFPPALPPSGAIPLFATGITDVRMSDISPVPDSGDFHMAIDRATNSVIVSAERYACASWDGVTFCRVDLTLPA